MRFPAFVVPVEIAQPDHMVFFCWSCFPFVRGEVVCERGQATVVGYFIVNIDEADVPVNARELHAGEVVVLDVKEDIAIGGDVGVDEEEGASAGLPVDEMIGGIVDVPVGAGARSLFAV